MHGVGASGSTAARVARGRGIERGRGEARRGEGEERHDTAFLSSRGQAGRQGGGGTAHGGGACLRPEGGRKKKRKGKRKHILQKTPWVLRKLVRVVRELQKIMKFFMQSQNNIKRPHELFQDF